MGRDPKSLGEAIESLFRELGFEKKVDQMRVLEIWPQIVGPTLTRIAQADRVDNGILYVKVAGMTWRTELLFQKPLILQKIAEKLGEGVINDIRFF